MDRRNPAPLMQLKIKREHWNVMRAHVQENAPLEACGLLAGKNDSVEAVLPITNQVRSPVRFRMDPAEQLRAFNWMEAKGLDLLGIFHSHPAGPAIASPADLAEAAYPVVHLIWSRSTDDWQARGFWFENGRAAEVNLEIIEAEQPS
jgi:proteasome lid subunit RPN8/RPN11